jgi:hypothetical protein
MQLAAPIIDYSKVLGALFPALYDESPVLARPMKSRRSRVTGGRDHGYCEVL